MNKPMKIMCKKCNQYYNVSNIDMYQTYCPHCFNLNTGYYNTV